MIARRHAFWAPLAGMLALLAACGPDGSNETATLTAAAVNEQLAGLDIPDCYAASGLGVPAPAPARAVFVLVDQTTGLDDHLRATARDNLAGLLQPGATFTISTFSAFSRDHYATNLDEAGLQAPIPEAARSALSVRGLERLDACLGPQAQIAVAHAAHDLDAATGASSASFSNSEIMASLAQLSQAVRASTAPDKVVIVISDLMEHSAATSFYRNRTIRVIDPAAEMQKAERNQLLGDFGGARIAVIGAGLLSPGSRTDATRDTAALASLHDFWQQWFERSHARLVAYGQPDLVAPIP